MSMSGEDVPKTRRGFLGKGRKWRIWKSREGLCAWCMKPVEWIGPNTVYDHFIPLALGGPDTDDNLRPLHRRPCDAIKTALDVKRIAKAERLRKRINGTRRVRKKIESPGFDKRLRKKMSGEVVKRD